MTSFKVFSGDDSLRFLAKDMKVKDYGVRQAFEFENTLTYTQGKIPIGIDEFGDIVNLNMKHSNKILVLGGTGGGKTFLMRNIMDRFYAAGRKNNETAIANLTDIKPEFYTSVAPVQKQFYKFLLPNEKPTGLPVKSFKPYFLSKLTGKTNKSSENFQFSLQDLNRYDFETLLGGVSDAGTRGLNFLFELIREGKINSLDDMIKEIKKDEEVIDSRTKKPLIGEIINIQNMGVIGNNYPSVDFTEEIMKGNIPILDVEGFRKTGGKDNYINTYIGMITRNISTSKSDGLIPKKVHILMMYDECNRFVPSDGNPVSKKEILTALDLTRSEKISMVFSSQDYTRIPGTILEQCNIILVSHLIKTESFKNIIKEKSPQEYDHPVTFGVDMARKRATMGKHKDGSRDWLLIDANSNDESFTFRPLAPLSAHKLE